MFTDVDYIASLGLSIKGSAWSRPDDAFGLAGLTNGISHVEQQFLAAGGAGILAGDGRLDYGCEKILETYYDFAVWNRFMPRSITNLLTIRPSIAIVDRFPFSQSECIGSFESRSVGVIAS